MPRKKRPEFVMKGFVDALLRSSDRKSGRTRDTAEAYDLALRNAPGLLDLTNQHTAIPITIDRAGGRGYPI